MDAASLKLLFVLVVPLLGVAGSWFVVRYKVNSLLRDKTATDMKIVEIQKENAAIRERVNEVRSKAAHDLAEFREKVAEEYATTETMRRVEDKIVSEIHSLRDVFVNALTGNNN